MFILRKSGNVLSIPAKGIAANFFRNAPFHKQFSNFIESREYPKDSYLKHSNKIKIKFTPKIPEKLVPTIFQKENFWNKGKKRVGTIATKMGKISYWDKDGVSTACTVVRFDNLQSIEVKSNLDKMGNALMVLGSGQKNWNRMRKSERGFFEKAGLPYKSRIKEFPVSQDGLLPVGTPITVRHYIPGQLIDVKGTTKGKGFAGTIKRYNFKRQPKSHGATKVHRKPGSQGVTGAGRVFPGKKGPGRMGGKSTTILNLRIMKIDADKNIMFIKGDIPGPSNSFIYIRDSLYKPSKIPLPYPTFVRDPYEKEAPILIYDSKLEKDPFEDVNIGEKKLKK